MIRDGNFTLIPILRVPRLEDGLAYGGKGCGEGRAAVRVLSSFFKKEREGAEPPGIKARCQPPSAGSARGRQPRRISRGV